MLNVATIYQLWSPGNTAGIAAPLRQTSIRTNRFLRLLLPLLFVHIATYCLSLFYVAEYYDYLPIIAFDKAKLPNAVLNIALFATVSFLFAVSRFSFGYFLGFYSYSLILGYLWLVEFSVFHYNHMLAAASAFLSALAFLIPALFITAPIPLKFVLSDRAFDKLLSCILIVGAIIVGVAALYRFRIVGIADIYHFQNEIEFPVWLRYAIGMTLNALLPFAFAGFFSRGSRWRAAASLLLLLLFYPSTLTKMAIFAPFWLLFLAILCRFFEARFSIVLSLLLPVVAGLSSILLTKAGVLSYPPINSLFGTVNFRMVAVPSMVFDAYNDFFSNHSLTYFCQISFLKPLVICPYTDPLSIVMAGAYHVGNLNASLFATEGIASVGPILAPLTVLGCGLVISLANGLSSGLPPKFVVLSGGVLVQTFLNVPLTTMLLTNGAGILFLLWYVTPRSGLEIRRQPVRSLLARRIGRRLSKKLVQFATGSPATSQRPRGKPVKSRQAVG